MSIFNNSEENSIFKRSGETKKEEPSIFGESSPDVFSNESPTDIFGSDNLYSNRSPFVSGPNVLKRGYANSSGSSSSGLKSSYTLTIDSDQQQMAEKFKKEFKVFTDSFFKLIENIKDDAFKKQIAEKFINDLESNAKMAMENTETLDKYIKLSIAANKDKSSLTGSGLDYQFGFLVSKGSSLNLKNPDLLFLKNQPTEIKHKKVCLILSLIMNDSELSPFSLSDEDFKKKIASAGNDLRTKYSMVQWPTELNSVKYWPLYAYLISLFDKGTLNLGDLEKEVNVNIMAEGSGEAPKKKEEDKKKDEKKGGGKDDKKKDDKKKKEPKIPFVKERNLRYFLDKYEDYSFGKMSGYMSKIIKDKDLYFTVNDGNKNKNDLFQEIFFKQGVFDDLKKKLCKEGGNNFEEQNNENQVFHSAFDYPEKNITINDLYRLREKGNDFENIDEKLKKHTCNDKPIDTNFKIQFLKGQSLLNYYDKFSLYRINAFQNAGEFQPINSRVMKGLKIYFYSLGKESETFASLLRSKFGVEKKKAEEPKNSEKKNDNKKESKKKNDDRKPQNKQKEDKMRKIREVLKKTNDKLAQTKNANIKKKLEQAKAELLKEYKKLAN